MLNIFETCLESPTVDLLMRELANNNIDLNPSYQRGDVWYSSMRSNFIDSVCKGIIPQNITLNKEYKNNTTKYTCIDGKQRLTSLKMFMNNDFPLIIDDDNDVQHHIYYNKLPEGKNTTSDYLDYTKNLTIKYNTLENRNEIMQYFLQRKIPVAYYTNLSYADQADIFKRMQNSEPSTKGERYISNFKNQDTCKLLIDFFEKNNYMNCDRSNHIDYLIKHIMHVAKKELKKINETDNNKFIKKYQEPKKMAKLLDSCNEFLGIFYSDKIILNPKIKELKLIKYFKIGIGYLIFKKFDNYKEDIKKIRKLIKRVWKNWTIKPSNIRSCTSNSSLNKLEILFEEEFENIDKKFVSKKPTKSRKTKKTKKSKKAKVSSDEEIENKSDNELDKNTQIEEESEDEVSYNEKEDVSDGEELIKTKNKGKKAKSKKMYK